MSESLNLGARAARVLPGGVNSPVRAFKAVGAPPRFFVRGEGARLTDADGRTMIDLVGSWGPLILGHAHPAVTAALKDALGCGTSFGACCPGEVELAERVVAALPSVEMVRFTSSGTEATMAAVRLARAATGRAGILKFSGCYHGHSDSLLQAAGSGVATLDLPDALGIPGAVSALTRQAPYNDLDAARALLEAEGERIAAVIVEPVAGNMGVVPPAPGFLAGLREACTAAGTLLIFDEVMTGFRVALGGVQQLAGITPDLTTLGKIIGGGLPVGAFGGRRELMEQIAPAGGVYHAGTLSGNPLAMAAGVATLDVLREAPPYAALDALGARLEAALLESCEAAGVPAVVQRQGSMLTLFFTDRPVRNFADAQRADHERFARYFRGMLEAGVFLPPSGYEAWFLNTALTDADLDSIVAAHRRAL